jgi:hypothetical protein
MELEEGLWRGAAELSHKVRRVPLTHADAPPHSRVHLSAAPLDGAPCSRSRPGASPIAHAITLLDLIDSSTPSPYCSHPPVALTDSLSTQRLVVRRRAPRHAPNARNARSLRVHMGMAAQLKAAFDGVVEETRLQPTLYGKVRPPPQAFLPPRGVWRWGYDPPP